MYEQKHNKRERERKKFHLQQSALKPNGRKRKMNISKKSSTHGMYKNKVLIFSFFFRQCFLSHCAYGMVEEKKKKQMNKQPIGNNNNNAHTH